MSKLVVLSGLPGSGKTTYARERVENDGNSIRVNRDDLRAMCFNSQYSSQREGLIIEIEKAVAELAKQWNMTAIIDDTNLRREAWTSWAKENGFTLERVCFDVPLIECIERDRYRANPVGRVVIENMARRTGQIQWPQDKKVVLCDLDGTLCDISHRLHFIQSSPKDYGGFFSTVLGDSPRVPVIEWLRALHASGEFVIVIVSGRSEAAAKDTLEWLSRNDVPFDHIWMRDRYDRSPDTLLKEGFLSAIPEDRIAFAIDDRQVVVDMWRKHGVRVFQVNDGDY